jgi:glycosyltransferase involved in cell wall biosynthesis
LKLKTGGEIQDSLRPVACEAPIAPLSFLLVCYSYPPLLGGSEIEAQRVSAAMIRRGHDVQVLCAGGDPMPPLSDWIDPCGVPVRMFGARYSGRWREYAFALGVAWTLLRDRKRYQTVYFLMQGIHLALGLPVARMLGKPVVMKISGSSIISAMRKTWLGRLELRWLQKWAYRILVLNAGIVEEARSAGFRPDQLLWMPNPVDVDEFAPCTLSRRLEMREARGIPQEALVVVYVGRLAPEKELQSLVKAFTTVKKQVPTAELILVGEGPERAELERIANERNVGIRLVGRVEPHEVLEWLQISDVFALVSSNEGLPCSLIEAMSVSLPAVVSDIPANTQLIEPGVHGRIAHLLDEKSIADALITLLKETPIERARIGQAGRMSVQQKFSTNQVAAYYESLFTAAAAVTEAPGKR